MLILIFYSDAEDGSEIMWTEIDRELSFPNTSSQKWKVISKGLSYEKSFTRKLNVRPICAC
jgi:hypothetical protein